MECRRRTPCNGCASARARTASLPFFPRYPAGPRLVRGARKALLFQPAFNTTRLFVYSLHYILILWHSLSATPACGSLRSLFLLQAIRCRTCSQMLLPPHSLQSLRLLPCSQMPLPPPSLHWLRLRPCSQHHCRRRTPCTRCVASRDDNGRCLCRRSPCRGSAAARAWRYHTRRTGGGAARAPNTSCFSLAHAQTLISSPLSLLALSASTSL